MFCFLPFVTNFILGVFYKLVLKSLLAARCHITIYGNGQKSLVHPMYRHQLQQSSAHLSCFIQPPPSPSTNLKQILTSLIFFMNISVHI